MILNSAEFAAGQVKIGSDYYYRSSEEKLLVLHFTLRNPQKQELPMSWCTLHFTAVDATNANREYVENVGIEIEKSVLDMSVKPAQKVDAYTVIPVPAKGAIPKLIVKAGDDQVVRYDLKDKVKKLAAPYADPADKTGYTALAQVPCKAAEFYPTGDFDVRFDEASFKTAIGEIAPEGGNRLRELFITIKNTSPNEQPLYWSVLAPTLRTVDGDDLEWSQNVLYSKRTDAVDQKLKTGQELKVQLLL